MDFLLIIMFLIIVLSLVFFSEGILMLLVFLEFLVFILFLKLSFIFFYDSVLELMFFMVLSVGEGVLGLVLMLFKINFTGLDFILDLEI
nr:NADH dehydrogenase subunit 4L [Amblyseius swirskii]